MIVEYIQQAIRNIESQRNSTLENERQKLMSTVVAPYNKEIDDGLQKAIAELSTNLNKDISALQQKFETDKKTLVEMADKNKADFANTTISSRLAIVSVQFDRAIQGLTDQIEKIEE